MKLFTALENEEIDIPADGAGTLEEQIMAQDEAVSELNKNIELQEEAIASSETLEKMEAAETPEAAVQIAREHILATLGYKKQFSLEDFNNQISNGLGVAQEGFFSRIGNAFNRLFTTSASFKTRLDKALSSLKANGSKEGLLKDPNFSKNLIAKSDKVITSSDVVKYLDKLDSTLSVRDLDKCLGDISNILRQLTTEVTKSGILTNKDASSKIDAISAEIEKDIQAFERITAGAVIEKEVDMYPDYEPIKYNEASKIADRIFKTWTGEAFDTPNYRNFINASNDLNDACFERNNRSIGYALTSIPPEDMRKILVIGKRIGDVISNIADAVNKRYKVAHSCLRYIEQSANK
jgi:vacuolar-type H+-ATPase subunit I/STV1